ncbi:MAG: glycosyltransferase [Methanobrevibacter sp.]|jgi:glycosyltransferase involved in cell wall biosynthesis|nr:glycosyltransferase [Candidatus Methanovirga meridionalis]
MNQKYKLTSITSIYNGEKYLKPFLDSLTKQSFEEFEIILINDASTDNTLNICKHYQDSYSNIKIINNKINMGQAGSFNLGIKESRGDYIIFADCDDIIPEYSYEKLYEVAYQTNADIAIGKANRLIENYQCEMSCCDSNVWREKRIISSPKEFMNIFHDAFHWNKLIRRKFLIENDVQFMKNLIYHDRKFAHFCFLYASKIVIIPDCIYLWRLNIDSISEKNKYGLINLKNIIISFKSDLDILMDYDTDYFKFLLRRILGLINGVLINKEFKKYFFSEVFDFIKSNQTKVKNIYNGFNTEKKLYIYLILKGDENNLIKLINLDLNNERKLLFEGDDCYWKLPFFRNPKYDIPDEFFKVKYLSGEFVNFDDIIIEDEYMEFKNIKIPKKFRLIEKNVLFRKKTMQNENLEENSIYLNLRKAKSDEVMDIYGMKLYFDKLENDLYDVYFQFRYKTLTLEDDSIYKIFPIKSISFKKINNENLTKSNEKYESDKLNKIYEYKTKNKIEKIINIQLYENKKNNLSLKIQQNK